MYALKIRELTKIYPNNVRALAGVNLDVAEGDFFGLLGANGAGKTTMIGIISDLVTKTSGDIEVFGLPREAHLSRVKKDIGLVPQEMNFNMFEKVEDIVLAQAGFFGIPRATAKKNLEPILKTLGLWDKRSTVSRRLSGGMKRRLMLARALIHNPKLLFLDEPTAGVDVELRHSLWDYLRELNKSGTTIFLTTHYLEEAEQLCRNVAIIREGVIVKQAPTRQLIRSLESEIYVVHVDHVARIEAIKKYNPVIIDDATFEVELQKTETLNSFIDLMTKAGIGLVDIRPKGNRLERLFLNVIKGKHDTD